MARRGTGAAPWIRVEQFRWALEQAASGDDEEYALRLLKACAWLSGRNRTAWRLAAEPSGARWTAAYADLFEYLRLFLAAGLSVDEAVRFGQDLRRPSLDWFELVASRPSLRRVVRTRFFDALIRSRGTDLELVALLKAYADLLDRVPGAEEAFQRQVDKVACSRWTGYILRDIATKLRRYLPKDVRENLVALLRKKKHVLAAEAKYVLPLAEARSSTDRPVLEQLARHSDWAVRAALAENPALPQDLMVVLARDSEPAVLRALAARQDLPDEARRILEAAGITVSAERPGWPARGWHAGVPHLPGSVPVRRELPAPCISALAGLLAGLLRKRAAEELVRLLARRLTAAALPSVRVPRERHPSRPFHVAWVLGYYWKKAIEAIRNRRYGIPGGRWLARIESAVLQRCGFLALHVREQSGNYLCTVFCRGGGKVQFWLLSEDFEPDFRSLTSRPDDLVPAALLVQAACVVAGLVVRRELQASSPGLGCRAGLRRHLWQGARTPVRVILVPRQRSRSGRGRRGCGSGYASAGGFVPWHFRRLHPGWAPSPQARANALYYAGITELPEGMTFVRPHWRAGSDPSDKLFVSSLARSFAASLDSVW